jgi:hypothetical protein
LDFLFENIPFGNTVLVQRYRLNAINKTLGHIKSPVEDKQDLQKDIFRRKAQLHQVTKMGRL